MILDLRRNKIDDEGVAVLIDALQNNTSLKTLDLRNNDGISNQGRIMLLKLVNDISSIKATLQSNHTLRFIYVRGIIPHELLDVDAEIQMYIDMATGINRRDGVAGKEKVIDSHQKSWNRTMLADIQGIDHSFHSEINPLHLPEVLSLIGERHGQEELYVAVSSSIMALFSTVNRKKWLQQQMKYHAIKAAEHRTKVEELGAA